jgi:hypothetical protein
MLVLYNGLVLAFHTSHDRTVHDRAMYDQEDVTMSRPTIAQLEAILESEEEVEIEILPNGEVREKGQTSLLETGGRKPLTMREDLGGEYSES